MRIELGAPIILFTLPGGLGDDVYHLPAETAALPGWHGRPQRRRYADLDMPPTEWPTLCGLQGIVYAYNGTMRQRHMCGVCRPAAPGTLLTLEGGYTETVETKKPRRHSVPAISDAQVTLLHNLYLEKHVGLSALGELYWHRLGFKNPTSLANTLNREFRHRGLEIRTRAGSHRRTVAGRRLIGYGGQRAGEQRIPARIVDRLWRLYELGHPVAAIARRFHTRFGYETAERFEYVVEYAWKTEQRKLRTNSEAELLSRARLKKLCAAMKTGADGRRPRPCTQRPLNGSEFCLHHDPDHRDAVCARADALRARKPLKPRVAWSFVLPHLGPLLAPQPDRVGRTSCSRRSASPSTPSRLTGS